MAEEPWESMVEEAGLAADEYADVTAMLGAVRSAVAELPAPAPSAELAAMLGAPPVRRISRRRRIGTAAGGTALILGSLGGAAAADVLPEPVQDVVVEFPGFPGGPPSVSPGVPGTSADASAPPTPAAAAVPPPSIDLFGVVPDVAPPTDRRAFRSARPGDLPGERKGVGGRSSVPPAGSVPGGPPAEPGSKSSGRADRADGADGAGRSDAGAKQVEGWPGPRRPLPRGAEDEPGQPQPRS